MPFRIVHQTSYAYESTVSASYGTVHLLPRDTPYQRVVSARMDITPEPNTYSEHADFYGNKVSNFAVLNGHSALTVTATSVVSVTGAPALTFGAGPSWESVAESLRTSLDADLLDARQFVLDSPSSASTSEVRAYALSSLTPGRPLVDVLSDLTGRINADFEYVPGVTDLTTSPDDLLNLRKGVCQDFAHLQIACLRSFGLAARYVSGYLETEPPPGQVRLQGADVSHAWVSAFVPTIGWVDVDPTNNLFVGSRHICTAWGRDYDDVSPLRGVIFTEAKSNTMTVSVDVTSEPA